MTNKTSVAICLNSKGTAKNANIFIYTVLFIAATALFAACKSENKQETVMNETLENILNRVSVREYSNRNISSENILDILKAGMAAPSSRDRRPWHFILLSDKSIMQKLGEQLKNASCLKNADKAIIVCGDTEISDNCWFLDCSAAAQNILLAAQSMGIGAVWTAAYPYEDRMSVISKTFNLPENIKALAVIPMGYPATKNQSKDKFTETRIHTNKW